VLATKPLLNHRNQSITAGYQENSLDCTREGTDRVTEYMLERARGEERESGAT